MQGCTGLVARSKGSGKHFRARYYFGQIMFLVFVFGVGAGVIGYFLSPVLLKFLGATAEQAAYAYDYLKLIFLTGPLFLVVLVLSGVLSAYGNTKTFRNALVTTSILNIGLDPLFMFGWGPIPRLGMQGIGLATVFAFFTQLLIMLPALLKLPLLQGWRKVYFLPRRVGIKNSIAQSWPPSLNMVAIGAGFWINTYFIAQIDTIAIAAYGIALRVEQLILLPAHGLTIALLAIAGQNFGAKQYERVHDVCHRTIKVSLGISVIGAVLMLGAGRFITSLFNEESAIIDYGYQYFVAASFLGFVYVYAHVGTTMLQALGRPKLIGMFGAMRLIVLPIILCPIFVIVLEFGVIGVWISLVIANTLTTIFLFWYSHNTLHKLAPQTKA